MVGGYKTFYAYKDEKTGIALVGDESNYQPYEKLAVQQRIAQQECQAAEMRRDAAYGWYGPAGGPLWGDPTVRPGQSSGGGGIGELGEWGRTHFSQGLHEGFGWEKFRHDRLGKPLSSG